MESFAGRILGDYRILEEIGAGGMGRVFLAENVHHKKPCALKMLPEELSRDVTFRARFFDEARVMSDLNHPCIVRVHHTGEDKGIYYLVMDYVCSANGRSHSIHDELTQSPARRLAPAQVHQWLTQVAQAMAYAHGRGVIHRDLKPANILIDADGNARITDFGLAKAVGKEFLLSQIHKTLQQTTRPDVGEKTAGALGLKLPGVLHDFELAQTTHRDVVEKSPNRPSRSGDSAAGSGSYSLFGTYDYMSPELLEGKDATPQSDIYSLGVMMYRMLTGRRPVGLAKPPSTLVRGLSRKWDGITARCLAHSTGDRYPGIDALLADLAQIGRGSCRRIAAALAGVLLVGALCAAAWTYLRPSMPGPETGMLKSAQPVRTKVTLPDEEERIHETSKPLVSAAPVVPTGTDEPKPVEVHNQADVVPPPADEKNAKDQEIAAEKAHVQDAAPAVQSPPAVAPVPQVPQPPSPVTLVREEIAKHLRVIAERTEGDQFLPRAAESIPADSNNLDELRAWETQTKELAAFLGGGNWPGSYDRNQFYLSQDGQRLLEQKPLQPADLRAWRAALGGYPIDAGLFVRIPAGRQEIPLELRLIRAKGLWFQMGIPRGAGNRTEEVSDPPQRVVPLSSDFYLGRYEITQRQYQAVTGENPSLFQTDHPNDPNRPVERVSWDQAVAFCAKLSGREDLRFFLRHGRQYREYNIKGPVFRLPEEREWEYACRGQEGMRENPPASWPEYLDFHNTYHRQDLGTVCWYAQRTIDAGTCPVGGRNPNSFGLYDMHGNVWEWCRGDYQDTEGGRLGGTGHIVRGGAYDSRWSECRSGWRDGYAKPRENIGFRVVLEVP